MNLCRFSAGPDFDKLCVEIENVDTEQRQMYLVWAESSYIMSVWNSLSYLLVSIMVLSQDRVTMIRFVKFRMNSIAFTIKAVLKATPIETWTKLHRQVMKQIYIYIYYLLCFGRQCYPLKDLIIYTQA